jgi:quinoprotein glucose dehydrogenase
MNNDKQTLCRSILAAATLLAACQVAAQQGATGGEWRAYSGDNGATMYSPLDQIDRDNAARLRIAWRRPAVDASILEQVPNLRAANNFRATPLMIDGVLYSPNGIGFVEAFDPGTGQTIWVEAPFEDGPAGFRGTATRGVAHWTDGTEQRILVQRRNFLLALDVETGEPIADFGDDGRVDLDVGLGPDLTYTWSGAPLVVGDVVVLGMSNGDNFANKEAPRGDVRAYDVRTGELRWQFHVIPQADNRVRRGICAVGNNRLGAARRRLFH